LNIFFGNPEGSNSTIIKIRYFAEMKFFHHYWFYYTLILFSYLSWHWNEHPRVLTQTTSYPLFPLLFCAVWSQKRQSSLNLKCGVLDPRSLSFSISFSSVEFIVHLVDLELA
jgi:hypothetical protein